MAIVGAHAYYGKYKKLKDDTWRGVGADIERRLACGDLNRDLNFLSFAGRSVTTEGWLVLAVVLRRLSSCTCLELQRCGINDVGKLAALLPELMYKTKCINLEGNALSAKNVRKLADAMAVVYAQVRPTWLSIGADAQETAAKCLTETACHPHHPRGCICSRPSVVHVVRNLPKYDPIAKARWEEEYLRPLEQYTVKRAGALAKPLEPPPSISSDNWPALSTSGGKPPTPPTKTPSGGDSPKELHAEDAWSDCAQPPELIDAECVPSAPRLEVADANGIMDLVPALPKAAESYAQKPLAAGPADVLMTYVSLEKRAQEMEILCRLAGLSDICAAPLEAAARFTRSQAATAIADLRADGGLTCWLIGERLLLLAATTEDRMLLIDLTESALRGDVVDARGAPACGARPLRDFNFRATALPFAARPDQHELAVEGGDVLEINGKCTTYLVTGWVAARPVGASAYLWFPLDHCRFSVGE